MRIDPATLWTILGMAAATYLTRIAGLLLADRLVLSGRAKAAFEAIPPAVLIAVIAPTALATGWPETVAAAITMMAALRLPLLATIAVGVAAVVALRMVADLSLRASWRGGGKRPRRLDKPRPRRLIQLRRQHLAHPGVVRIEPFALLRREQRRLDERPVDRREGQRLEAEHLALGAGDLAPLDEHEVLDADAVLAGLVVARLIRQDHARLERLSAELRQPLRPLVDREVAADAVAGAVVEIEPGLP